MHAYPQALTKHHRLACDIGLNTKACVAVIVVPIAIAIARTKNTSHAIWRKICHVPSLRSVLRRV